MKYVISFLGALTLAIAASGQAGQAVRVADGTVYFNSPPRLVGASTTQNTAYAWGATYYFNLQMPDNAGEPLQKVVIVQQEGSDDVRFDPKESEAVVSDRDGKNKTRVQTQVAIDPQSHTVTVSFEPAIEAGKTVRIGLSPVRNPSYGGVYLFGVTAFPRGDKTYGQFLGYGRLQFYDRGDWFGHGLFWR